MPLQDELNLLIEKESSVVDFVKESTSNCIWYKNLSKDNDDWLNSTFWKSLGYDPSRIINHSAELKNVISETDLQLLLDKVDEHDSSYFITEVSLKNKDGGICWASCKSMVLVDASGSRNRLLVTLKDITKRKELELKLRANTQHYHQLIEGTEIGTWQWNVQTGETKYNERWANILGYELLELEPATIQTRKQLTNPEDYRESKRLLQFHLDGHSDQYESEIQMQHRDGHWIWMLDKGKVVSWTLDGKPEWMIGHHQDIHSRKTNELLLLEYKTLLDRCNETARIGTWEMNLREQKLTWSKVTSEIHEVEPGFVPDVQTALEFYKEGESRDTISALFAECTAEGKSYDIELEIMTAKGNPKWVKAVGIPKMENEVCVHVYGLFQDIDDQKRAVEKLEFQEEQFRKTFEYAAIGMALVDLDGKWLKVNRTLCEMLGYSSLELLKTTFQEITHPDDLSTDLQFLNEMLSNERDTYQMEKRYFHKDSSLVWVLLSVSLVKNDKGEPLHFVSQINNITGRKVAEEKSNQLLEVTQKQNEKLLNFAHIVSHNLRSHTGNISMLLDLMQELDPATCKEEFFPMIKAASKNLSTTVQHLNEVATINYHTNDNIELLNLNEYVEKAIMNVKALSLIANAKIENSTAKKCEILAIPAYLDSILLNFLTNAIKYRSEARKLHISISCFVENDFTVIEIKDNGLGIDLVQNKEKLFGMYKTFHQHDESRGIGLFITKNQIEALGGKVEVESSVNKGSIFRIHLKNEKD